MPKDALMGIDERGILVACPACGQRNRLKFATLGVEARCGQCKTPLPFPAATIPLNSSAEFRALVDNSAVPVLIDFWAPWCGPCKMVAPELDKVAAQSSGRFLVAKVNTDELQDVAAAFRISSIPTLALMHQGREITRQAGAAGAPAIMQFVERSIREP
jgi:thioredoxin 2